MKLGEVLCAVMTCGLLATVACGSGGGGEAVQGADSNSTVGSRLSVNEQRSCALDDVGVCRTTCKDDEGEALSDCRAGLFADPAFCSQDDNMCKKAKSDDDYCRNPDGRFAVALCCSSMCEGARLTKDTSTPAHYHCRGTDGTFVSAGCCNKAASGIPLSEVSDS